MTAKRFAAIDPHQPPQEALRRLLERSATGDRGFAGVNGRIAEKLQRNPGKFAREGLDVNRIL